MPELRIRLGATDLSRLRWAISPAWELLASLRVLGQPGLHAIHMSWLAQHRNDPLLVQARYRSIRELAVELPGPLPGFLAPTPESPLAELEDELRVMRATPAEVVRREVLATQPRGVPASLAALLKAPRRELPVIATGLHEYWQRAIAPLWPRMRGVLERDIQQRAMILADRGPGAMLDELHRDIRWDPENETLVIRGPFVELTDPERSLVGRGLVLVPSVFAWPRVYVKTAEPWIPVIRYPARGVGTLWEAREPAHQVAAALGTTRARLLELLETPATTGQLAHQLRLAPGGVSMHLHRLVAAGLVAKARVGREVFYARTARGDHLLR